MSFSSDIKKELSEINNLANKEEVKFELLGYLKSRNCVNNEKKLKYSTENEYNINRFAKLLKNVNINNYKIEIQGKIYIIEIRNKDIEENVEFLDLDLAKENEIKAYIRGLYMGAGSINNPENQYHLEIEFKQQTIIQTIIQKLKQFNINVKSIENTIYIKDSEEISKFLAFIGAGKSVLNFEEIRVQREMNNKVNRIVNCEAANLNKVLNASIEQIEAIKKLKKNGDFNKLDDSLKEIANLRLAHPDMPLANLGELLKKPIGKSGVNYRLKKIVELSK